MNAFGSFLYGTDNHGSPILGDIVLLKEGINSDGDLDLLDLTELDIKHLCTMAVTVSGGEIKPSWDNPLQLSCDEKVQRIADRGERKDNG